MTIARRLALTTPDDLRREIREIAAPVADNDIASRLSQLTIRIDRPDEAVSAYLRTVQPSASVAICAGTNGALIGGSTASILQFAAEAAPFVPTLAAALRTCLTEPGPYLLRCGNRTIRTGAKTEIMGIVNMTDNSFSGTVCSPTPTLPSPRANAS
jgi:hypothetical protein